MSAILQLEPTPETMSRYSRNDYEEEEVDEVETEEETAVLIKSNEQPGGKGSFWKDVRPYSMYVLIVLLLAYLFNQLDRYMVAITILPLSQEIGFGDKACFHNESVQAYGAKLDCKGNGTTEAKCTSLLNPNGTSYCYWDYNGQGWDYQIVAGPVFILIYTFSGIFIGFAADQYNRKLMLAFCLTFWSAMTLLTGLVQEYWQLVVLRLGLGLGEAGCTPFAASLITDYFTQASRGTALGVYNFGIYFGYSLSYAVGNFITEANINNQGWRWAFILPGIPGILLGVIIALTVREPSRSMQKPSSREAADVEGDTNREVNSNPMTNTNQLGSKARLLLLLKSFTSPSLILLCLAGSIRNAGGYVWAYNTQPYFDATGVTTTGQFMSWIPLVGGSLGVLFGGFISDTIIKRRGLYARIFVLVVSQLVAAPFAAGALFLDAPWAFISLIPANIIGEMWVGVTLAVGVELVPSSIRTSAIAFYLFIISNIGGNITLLVPPLQQAFENGGYSKTDALRGALYVLYPGLFVAGGLLFLLTLFVVKRDYRRAQMRALTIEISQ